MPPPGIFSQDGSNSELKGTVERGGERRLVDALQCQRRWRRQQQQR